MNFKLIENFISTSEIDEILKYGDTQQEVVASSIGNIHVKKINENLKGSSITCDMTCTEISSAASKYQGDATCVSSVPAIFHNIKDKIASIGIDKSHVFFQYLELKAGGKVPMHYDVAVPGYITYKCNVAVVGPEIDEIYIDKEVFPFPQRSLYCFEASLYKHWAIPSSVKRIVLSYGFLLPYSDLGWSTTDPRVKLSNRLWKKFQNIT